MEFNIIRCPYCGNEGHLEHKGEIWYCAYCNNSCTDNSAERAFIKLGEKLEANLTSQIQGIVDAAFMKKREEEYFNLRSLLWEKTHAKYIDSSAIISVCRDIKKLEPHDFLANFYETANSATPAEVSEFLHGIDVFENEMFIDLVLDFMIDSLTGEYIMPVGYLIERAYKGQDLEKFEKYVTRLESEAEKVERGIYATMAARDVFIAYSSKDIKKVIELMQMLESNGFSCFVAMRNLQHGRGAVANYTNALHEAIRNCKMLVFVSSKNSRTFSCDAIMEELAYIKDTELASAPPEYRNNYDRLPEIYKKPRSMPLRGFCFPASDTHYVNYCFQFACITAFFHISSQALSSVLPLRWFGSFLKPASPACSPPICRRIRFSFPSSPSTSAARTTFRFTFRTFAKP